MNKTFKKTYVAVGAGLTLFAALSLTLMPSIAFALTAMPPVLASDGALSLQINGGTACTATQRLTYTQPSGVPTLSCSNVGSGTGTVTDVSAFADGGLVVTGTATTTPIVGITACQGTIGTRMLTNKHATLAEWQCDDVPVPLILGTTAGTALAGDTAIPAVIPAIITFTTDTPLSAQPTGTSTIYASLSGSLSGSLGAMLTPLPVGAYKNLTCRNSVNTGNATSTVEFFTGPCGGTTATNGSLKMTLPNSTDAAYSGTTATSITWADNCGVIKITKTASYAAGTLNCSLERTS